MRVRLGSTSTIFVSCALVIFSVVVSTLNSGCGLVKPLTEIDAASTPIPPAKLYLGTDVSGAWTPSVSGTGSSNEKGTITVSSQTFTETGVGMVRFQDTWGSKEVTVDLGTYDAANDFGYSGANGNGSITLTADVLNYPYSGGAYPVLTSFKAIDGATTTEFVNTKAACASSGMWTCAGGTCDANTSCTVTTTGAGSSFFNRDDWDQHQFPPYGYTSVNAFPRCDPTVSGSWGTCPAAQKKLPTGHYYAKYILMSDRGVSVASATADLRVKMTIKKDTAARNTGMSNGAVNINVILVGSKNINDSHTAKGAQNLNLLFAEVNDILKGDTNVSLGEIKVFEWRDEDGGDYYSSVNYEDLGVMFASGSKSYNAANNSADALEDGKAINIFMVRDIEITGVNYSILGLAGGILGPAYNGTQGSGLAFGTHISTRGIATFNPSGSCTLASCPRDAQEGDFLEMASTIAHEMGHYLGLNHPSEKVSSLSVTQRHDQLTDTPTCTSRDAGVSGVILDHVACMYQRASASPTAADLDTTCKTDCTTAAGGNYYTASYNGNSQVTSVSKTSNYCPAVTSCQFNHVMWYTTKNRVLVSGTWKEDGNQFSPQSSSIVQWNSYVR